MGTSVGALVTPAGRGVVGMGVVDWGREGFPGRSTVSFGSSSPQLGSFGWETDGSSPIPSFVSASPSGISGVAAGVTSSRGSIGPTGGNKESMGQLLRNRFLYADASLRAAIQADRWKGVGRWRQFVNFLATLKARSTAVW